MPEFPFAPLPSTAGPRARAARRPRVASLIFAALALVAGCNREPASGPAPAPANAETATTGATGGTYSPDDTRRAADLFVQLATPGGGANSAEQDRWIEGVRRLMEGMASEPPTVGLALLALAVGDETKPVVARRLGVEAGAIAAGPLASDLLSTLITEFGPQLELRDAAVRALPKADPARALEVLGPILRERPRSTLPPYENMLASYLEAAAALGADPVPVLSVVAADMQQDQATRHQALRELGSHQSTLSVRVLEEVLVESSGNAYLRRLAGQSLLQAASRGEACAIFERVMSREADPEMLAFFADMVERHCP